MIEVFLRQPHEQPVAFHDDGGVAFAFRQQRLLAEGIAIAQLREGDPGSGGRGARDLTFAMADDVVVVTVIALLHDDLLRLDGQLMKAHEHVLDVRRRNSQECLGLQNARHPIATAARVDGAGRPRSPPSMEISLTSMPES